MKSYLLSWLRQTHGGATLDEFERERAGEWLVWEAGPWHPPAQKRETLVSGPQAKGLSSGESLAIQLVPRNTSTELRLGRDASNDVAIDDATLSRVHLVLERGAAGIWTVRDAGSRNGTTVDGARVGAKAAPLSPGSSIVAGSVRLTYYDAALLFARLRAGE